MGGGGGGGEISVSPLLNLLVKCSADVIGYLLRRSNIHVLNVYSLQISECRLLL